MPKEIREQLDKTDLLLLLVQQEILAIQETRDLQVSLVLLRILVRLVQQGQVEHASFLEWVLLLRTLEILEISTSTCLQVSYMDLICKQ